MAPFGVWTLYKQLLCNQNLRFEFSPLSIFRFGTIFRVAFLRDRLSVWQVLRRPKQEMDDLGFVWPFF